MSLKSDKIKIDKIRINMPYSFYNINKEVFYVLTTALAVFVILEILFPGIVLAYLNLNLLLILWLVDGILLIITKAQ